MNLCAKATLISLIMNNGGGNREACLCKFPHTVISFMFNSQNSGGASENNLPASVSSPQLFDLFLFAPHHLFSFLYSHLPPAFMKYEPECLVCEKVLIPVPAEPLRLAITPPHPHWTVWDFKFCSPPSWPSAFLFLILHQIFPFLVFYAFHLHFYCFIACLSHSSSLSLPP